MASGRTAAGTADGRLSRTDRRPFVRGPVTRREPGRFLLRNGRSTAKRAGRESRRRVLFLRRAPFRSAGSRRRAMRAGAGIPGDRRGLRRKARRSLERKVFHNRESVIHRVVHRGVRRRPFRSASGDERRPDRRLRIGPRPDAEGVGAAPPGRAPTRRRRPMGPPGEHPGGRARDGHFRGGRGAGAARRRPVVRRPATGGRDRGVRRALSPPTPDRRGRPHVKCFFSVLDSEISRHSSADGRKTVAMRETGASRSTTRRRRPGPFLGPTRRMRNRGERGGEKESPSLRGRGDRGGRGEPVPRAPAEAATGRRGRPRRLRPRTPRTAERTRPGTAADAGNGVVERGIRASRRPAAIFSARIVVRFFARTAARRRRHVRKTSANGPDRASGGARRRGRRCFKGRPRAASVGILGHVGLDDRDRSFPGRLTAGQGILVALMRVRFLPREQDEERPRQATPGLAGPGTPRG